MTPLAMLHGLAVNGGVNAPHIRAMSHMLGALTGRWDPLYGVIHPIRWSVIAIRWRYNYSAAGHRDPVKEPNSDGTWDTHGVDHYKEWCFVGEPEKTWRLGTYQYNNSKVLASEALREELRHRFFESAHAISAQLQELLNGDVTCRDDVIDSMSTLPQPWYVACQWWLSCERAWERPFRLEASS